MAKQAIEGKRSPMFMVNPFHLNLVEDPTHYLYDERVHDEPTEAMVLSVLARGVMQNIMVEKDGDLVNVVAGRGRVKAAREAWQRQKAEGVPEELRVLVPVVQRKGDELDLIGALVTENSLRRDETPVQKAKKAQRMLENGATMAAVAVALGVSEGQARNYGKLLECSANVRSAVDSGRLPLTDAARKFPGKPKKEQDELLAELLADGGGKVTRSQLVRHSSNDVQPTRNRPKAAVVRNIYNVAAGDGLNGGPTPSMDEVVLLGWVLGEVSEADATGKLPWLRRVLDGMRAAT